MQGIVKVTPYSILTAREQISKISRWHELSSSTSKSRVESGSKMPTNMASKFLKFVYRKCCVDRLRFQNIYRLNSSKFINIGSNSNTYKYNFFTRTLKEWNTLPSFLLDQPSVDAFKSAVTNILVSLTEIIYYYHQLYI